MRDYRVVLHSDQVVFLRLLALFVFGIVIQLYLAIPHLALAVPIFTLGSTFLILLSYSSSISWKVKLRFKFFRPILVSISFVLLGMWTFQNQQEDHIIHRKQNAQILELTSNLKEGKKFYSFTGETLTGNKDNSPEKIQIFLPKNHETPSAGDHIVSIKEPTEISGPKTPFDFDYKKFMAKKGIYRQVFLNDSLDFAIIKQQKVDYLTDLRMNLLSHFKRVLDEENAALAAALILGYKNDLNAEQKNVFQTAGAMHVLAVSGMHVGIVYLLFSYCLRYIRNKKRKKYLSIFPVIGVWFFALLSGFGPPVIRAALVITFIEIGKRLQLPYMSLNVVAASALLLLIINPNFLFSLGFLLSYAAVFSIIVFFPFLNNYFQFRFKILQDAWSMTALSIAAQIGTIPLVLLFFKQFPLYSLVSNLLLTPLTAALIPAGILLLFFESIGLSFSLVHFCVDGLFTFTFKWLELIANIKYAKIQISGFSVALCSIYYLSLLFIIHHINLQGFPKAKNILVLTFASSIIYQAHAQLSYQNDSYILFEGKNGASISYNKEQGKVKVDTIQELKTPIFQLANRTIIDSTHPEWVYPKQGCIETDFFWVNGKLNKAKKNYLKNIKTETIIVGTKTDYFTRSFLEEWAENNGIYYHNIYREGMLEIK